jgi:glycosyltransferase involved in cell wall biosynthesis
MSQHPETLPAPRSKVILDCLGVRIGEQRGAERFICSLIAELAAAKNEDFLLLINTSCVDFVQKLLPRTQYVVLPISGKSRVLRMLVQMMVGPILARRHRAPLYVLTHVFPTFGFGCPTAAFLHDLMLYHFPSEFRPAVWRVRDKLLKLSIPSLSAIFTVSQFCAEDIARRFPKQADSIFVVHNGSHPSLVPLPPQDRANEVLSQLGLLDKKFVLSVLGGGKYKNPTVLVEASKALAESGRDDIQLVAVGDCIRVLRGMPCPANLRVLGFVSDEVLTVLYSRASALVFPSLFEGFGIPIIEAQAISLPVICSDIPVFREVGGDGVVFVDPKSPKSIADAILTLVDSPDLQQRLVQKGIENARRYTWRRSLEMFVSACQSVLESKRKEKLVTTTSA